MLALMKAQGYSNIKDQIVPGILEQQKSNSETQLMAEKIALEKMKFSSMKGRAAEQFCEVWVRVVAITRSSG